MNSRDIDKSDIWRDLLAKCQMEIERSSRTDANDPQRVKEGMREDCENADDRDAFFQLLRYELPSFGVDGSWRGLSPWEDERCGLCVEDQCRHDIYKYEHRGIPCVQFFVKEYPTTPIFLRELLSNPKLHVTVWNGFDGKLYEPKFNYKYFPSSISRKLLSENGDLEQIPDPNSEITELELVDFERGDLKLQDLQHPKFPIYICHVTMGMEWKDYIGMTKQDFHDTIEKFNIIDEVVSALKAAEVKPSYNIE